MTGGAGKQAEFEFDDRHTPLLSRSPAQIGLCGASFTADPSGALYWPDRRTLVVADLHLEKGSSFAQRGQFLPPYDTAATLEQLGAAIACHNAERVICLGDSFHDGEAAARLSPGDAETIQRLTARHDWIWICGNHDPAPPEDWGGRVQEELVLGALVFRHEAKPLVTVAGEVSGHFHPKAKVKLRAKQVTSRCFVSDGRRLILPAFGAYTGGLDVHDPAIASLMRDPFRVLLAGRSKLYDFPSTRLRRAPIAVK